MRIRRSSTTSAWLRSLALGNTASTQGNPSTFEPVCAHPSRSGAGGRSALRGLYGVKPCRASHSRHSSGQARV